MTTLADAITFLHQAAANYDLRREVHARNDATIAAAVAAVQARTASDLAAELERLAATGGKDGECPSKT